MQPQPHGLGLNVHTYEIFNHCFFFHAKNLLYVTVLQTLNLFSQDSQSHFALTQSTLNALFSERLEKKVISS
jgi:hypothetical protein